MTEDTTDDVRFHVNGKDYPMPTDLTLGEMCDAERYFGVEFGNNASSGIRMAAAMLWIAIKRVDQSVTVDDVRELPPDVFETFTETSDPVPLPSDAAENDSSVTSGDVSSNGGGDLAELPEATGLPV